MLSIILFIVSLVIIIPMVRKPLSEDDGNWFYPAVFWDKGVRIHENFAWAYGYFCIHWMAAKLYNLLKFKNLTFFYYFKITWYSLTTASIYWLTFCFWHNYVLSFIAGLIFCLITAIPNTLFTLTYGEHFYILPINLSMTFTYYGVTTGNPIFFILVGLMSAWAYQIKPTTLLFCILLPFSFYFAPAYLKAVGIYSAAFIILTCLPLFFIQKLSGDEHKIYLRGLIGYVLVLIKSLNVRFLNKTIDDVLMWFNWPKEADAYIQHHHSKNLETQWSNVKKNMLPAIKNLYLILILAAVQFISLFISFDPFVFAMVLLLVVFLLMVYFQKNYYTPHFNPCWAPISILAAKTIWDIWPYLLNSGPLGWAMIAFMGVESIKIGRIIIKSFSKSERNIFGFTGLGIFFRLAENIGKYIKQHSKENEKLFVWGHHPSIYLYSEREAFDTAFLFPYSTQNRILLGEELVNSLREKPPELLLFYNYRVNDGWDINKLQETIGIPYDFIQSFKIKDNKGRTARNPSGILFEFPLYRRDDEKYKEILLERALIARKNEDIDEARTHLKNILEIFPEDYEASIWLSLLGNDGSDLKNPRKYIEKELSEEHDSVKRSILLRLLADIDADVGDSDSAKKKYEKALDYSAKDFRIYNGLGELYFSKGNTEKALQLFKKAFDLNQYSADTLNNMGVVSVTLGKREEAIKIFEKALSFMPSHPVVINNLKALGCSQV